DQARGLYNYGARFYNPTWGRFISPDEAVQNFDSQGLNPYAYVLNAPTSRINRDGHDAGVPDMWAPDGQLTSSELNHKEEIRLKSEIARAEAAVAAYEKDAEFHRSHALEAWQAGTTDDNGKNVLVAAAVESSFALYDDYQIHQTQLQISNLQRQLDQI